MKYIELTSYKTGKPLWIREDQIASWYFERGHYHVVPLYDDVDIPVKESGEDILAKIAGCANDTAAIAERAFLAWLANIKSRRGRTKEDL